MKNERMMNESLYFDRGLRDLYRIDDYMTLEDYSAMMHHCIDGDKDKRNKAYRNRPLLHLSLKTFIERN